TAEIRQRRRKNRSDHHAGNSMRRLSDDEKRKDLIVAVQHRLRGSGLIVRKQHHTNQQKQRELKERYKTAQDDRLLTVALVPASQQTLYEKLISSVRSHRQERSAQQSRPESKRHREI